jgi:hypothetical protein
LRRHDGELARNHHAEAAFLGINGARASFSGVRVGIMANSHDAITLLMERALALLVERGGGAWLFRILVLSSMRT